MPIGNQPSSIFQINNQAAQLAIQLRSVMASIVVFQNWIAAQGATGLQNIGFSSTDAQAMLNQASYLNTVAGVYYGTVQQGGSGGSGASTFNFANELTALTGPT
jgi:hypothetical protein